MRDETRIVVNETIEELYDDLVDFSAGDEMAYSVIRDAMSEGIATCGSPRKNYFDEINEVARSRDCTDLGSYLCCGFDTYGPFKIIGGLKKGHPTEKEIQDAVDFYNGLGV